MFLSCDIFDSFKGQFHFNRFSFQISARWKNLERDLVRGTEDDKDRTYITVEAAEVNKTRAGQLSGLPVVNTQEEVQCEGGDH